ncbi:MAG: response regulator [Chloroflexota bacterium]|nr:response regulator [Chloroflexota bacterium]
METEYRLLIIDADAHQRTRYTDYFAVHGFDVETAVTGADALDKLRTRDFDVAVIDLALPDMSGLEVIRQAKKEWVNTRMIVATANGDRNDVVAALNLNVDAWVDKHDLDMPTFYATVKELAPLIPPDVAERLLASIRDED